MKHSVATRQDATASEKIDDRIAELDDWRGEMLGRIRALLKETDPEILEEWKWMGTPVWSHDGIVCTGETYKTHVKMTFAKGAALEDPAGLFNSSLDGNVRRAIDVHEGEKLNEPALKALFREAIALNVAGKKAKRPAAAKRTAAAPAAAAKRPKAAAPAAAKRPKAPRSVGTASPSGGRPKAKRVAR